MIVIKKLLHPTYSMVPRFTERVADIPKGPPTTQERRRARLLSNAVITIGQLNGVWLRRIGWSFRINGTKRLHLLHGVQSPEEDPCGRPSFLAVEPCGVEVVQVLRADGHQPLFFADRNPGKRWRRRLFVRGKWEVEVLELAEAIRSWLDRSSQDEPEAGDHE